MDEFSAPHSAALMPVMDHESVRERYNAVVTFAQSAMKENIDYGLIPGTGKRTLLKPGAEKLTTLFGLSPTFEVIEKAEDWMGEEHGGEPFFYYWYRCRLYRNDLLVAEGDGSCNSWEKKYRYRNADRVCPHCGAEAIKRSKFAPRHNPSAPPGWYCFAKIGGCGVEFDANDPTISEQ
ncbi:MAG: hypothetical protein ACRDIB_19665, partial [Ardenticatenaceae bacterium]